MESKTAKKRFCSDLHRVYWNRENKSKEISHFDKAVNLIWAANDYKKLKEANQYKTDTSFTQKEIALLNIHFKRACDDKKIKFI